MQKLRINTYKMLQQFNISNFSVEANNKPINLYFYAFSLNF